MAYFKSQFKRQNNSNGKYMYWFDTIYTQTDENRNEEHPLAINGYVINPEVSATKEELMKPPEDILNPSVWKKVYTQWIEDCSGAFVKCPSLEQCLARTESIVDPDAEIPSVTPEEEDEMWTLQWLPTKVKVDIPVFQIYWSPSYKVLCKSRITLDETLEVQQPEKTYTILPNTQSTLRLNDNEWIQEMADLHVPFADSTTLRLDPDVEAQKERFRRKVRDARIRAKLARYRAERMAVRYEEKFGSYPEEDTEEAQTEAETEHDE